jgi:hypothetical protein
MNMTDILLTVSVGCNLWFLFLLLYDRIMETRFVRFLKGIAGFWRSLGGTEVKQETARETPPGETSDIIGRSHFKMASTRTTAAILTQEAATSKKGIELSEEEATFDDGNTETVSHPAQVPEEKLDETFTSIPPSELEYGEDEPEDEEPDKKQASGSSFEDIDMAVRAIRKDSPSDEEMRHAGKVMTELDGTELFTRITERLTDEAMSDRLAKAMAVFVDAVNMTVTQQKEKVFVIPDNIEEFDFRNYV